MTVPVGFGRYLTVAVCVRNAFAGIVRLAFHSPATVISVAFRHRQIAAVD
ncbi:hypothetical protein Barb6_02053 [Bacteroidales bacterium Barb6]|nr:hypothetical protein Barb6_02053 [Bacteroidales bacterium Barb6]